MKLWLIKQSVNNGYDTFDSAVVVAPDDLAARLIHPHGGGSEPEISRRYYSCWAPILDVEVEYLGEAVPGSEAGDVICASFNAG